ncbi:energy-coupling factor transporter ATP-binding protein EcfA2 [Bradyrhizobium sp. USDA 326]|uniref:AAA family ATPase n=1 Tax=unclassified Bradyrhizobium TaxID=2631580 RepID=UPI00351634DA
MLRTIEVQNYKSIEKLSLLLGRINIFIGENGAGKSNILEAIALAGAAQADKLDNEFLASRGIRVTAPQLMRSAFKARSTSEPIKISVVLETGAEFSYELSNDNKPYSAWHVAVGHTPRGNIEPIGNWIAQVFAALPDDEARKTLAKNLFSKAEPDANGRITLKVEVPENMSPRSLPRC